MSTDRNYTNIVTLGLVGLVVLLMIFKDQLEVDSTVQEISGLIYPGETHFKNMRQLTFGGENAEAYFSSDGKKLILQAHVEKGDCDQIYILDLDTGEKTLVSTGDGVTTCSFFQYPNDDKIIYASTHHADKACPPPPDYSQGYVWKLHTAYDIFRADPDGKNLEQLTDADGYDAEATYAWDGSRIIYTSLSSGDLDLWTMNPDGSDKRQLTDRLGYDGGAFYSHDGSRIVWRAYYPEKEEKIAEYQHLLSVNAIRPMALQIMVMNADGTEPVQITANEAANFAPFFFPDDKRIVFVSNQSNPQGRNFDAYAVEVDGSNLERITTYEGFDGFPMFSPDGKYFVFASNRHGADPGDTNIFICEWVN